MIGKSHRGRTPEHGAQSRTETVYHVPVIIGKGYIMAKQKQKKRADGRYCKSFRYNGKKVYVYARTEQELAQAEHEKRTELETGAQDRENPTLNKYYERFTDHRRRKVKESTIRCQSFQFQNCADVQIDKTGRTLGEMRIQEIKPYDIQAVQAAL